MVSRNLAGTTIHKGQSPGYAAAAGGERGRPVPVARNPGMLNLDLMAGGCERWAIRLRPGHLAGTPIARADGITLYAPAEQLELLTGLSLDYRGDISGGGFLMRPGEGVVSCACGAAFSRPAAGRQATQ